MIEDTLFVASKIFWLFARPNTFALFLACLGGAALIFRARWGRWPLMLGLGWFVAVLLTPLPAWITLPLEDRFPRPAEVGRVDGVIILGGAVEQLLTERRGIPALNGAAERMTEAVILARQHPEARIVFTGGQGSLIHGGMTEADVARALWSAMGLDQARVTYESESRNTHQNAVLTKALINPAPGETWLLVTSASHMPRSVGVFRQAGFPIVPWPVNYRTGRSLAALYDAPFPERIQQFEGALREWVGLTAYWLMGRTDAVFPAP
jgi:uncharacterized SAM-binding protein YcdF (DUF218 family)